MDETEWALAVHTDSGRKPGEDIGDAIRSSVDRKNVIAAVVIRG